VRVRAAFYLRNRLRPLVGLSLFLPLSCGAGFGQPAASPPDGAAIFHDRCAKCHGERGEGVSALITIAGPNIQAEHNPGDVMTAMEVGPSHMPVFADLLTVDEMHAVADYVTRQLAVIPLDQGNLAEGGKLFREYCAPCHRTAVRGGALGYTELNAPNLVDKSRALIAGAIRWGPGAMPAFPASVLNPYQLNSIVDYVKFVQQPPSPGGSSLHWYGPVAEGFVAWIVMFASIGIVGWIEKGGKG
jgi:ubiquinol-cytochrome c reductase cytochrome c subunit